MRLSAMLCTRSRSVFAELGGLELCLPATAVLFSAKCLAAVLLAAVAVVVVLEAVVVVVAAVVDATLAEVTGGLPIAIGLCTEGAFMGMAAGGLAVGDVLVAAFALVRWSMISLMSDLRKFCCEKRRERRTMGPVRRAGNTPKTGGRRTPDANTRCSRSSSMTVLSVLVKLLARFAISMRNDVASDLIVLFNILSSFATRRLLADGRFDEINWPMASVERSRSSGAPLDAATC